ncbi:restriction endonuclease subunit S [Novosphingobium arvoryzae]|uniref:Type I restriction modification enzyme, S subunit n=1 Tax=Novosphingobium arvoryzae TaxID=1256514 RepID=A0A918RF05_9SPHN|nr:restriction endonuclease subunit S [Novosphingobium arvoryzae]GGZ94116.1 type I restriction modification enzyme, S subunit [Novosphingobium arvoryzae]
MSWPRKNLGDIVDFLSGFAWKAANFSDDRSGVPIIRIQNVDSVRESDFVYWVDEYDSRFIVKEGDLLLTLSGSFRAEFWTGPDALLNQRIVKITPKSDIDRNWLMHSLRGALAQIEAMGRHALVNNVALSDLRQMQLSVPPLEEQKRIAAILDQADDIRHKRQHAIDRLNQLGQAIFHDMFGDLDANNHNFPIVALDKLIKVQGGYAFKSDLFGEDGDPVIRISNIDGESVDLEKSVKIAPENVGKGRSFTISEGDLLIAMSGATTGKTGTVPKFSGTAYLNQRVGKYIILDNKNISANFLVNLVKSEFYQKRILDQAWGAAQPNVSSNQLVSFAIPLPPICIQNRFSECMNGLSDVKSANYAELERSTSLFASLQHRAFTGQL